MKIGLTTLLFLMVALFGSALTANTTHAAVAAPAVLQEDECEPAQSTADNFVEALDLHSDVFTDEDWNLELSYREDNYSIQINRFPNDTTGVTTLNYLIYDCGYDTGDLEDYYDEDGFDSIMEVYSDVERTDECSDGGLTLYHYALEYENDDYVSRFWVVEYSENRVYDLQLTFLADEEDRLDALAEDLFPELPSC